MQHQNKLIIYQVMPRLFGNTSTGKKLFGTIEENGIGKFNDITNKALQEINALGATHIYYTGIIEHATLTDHTFFNIKKDHKDVVKGRAGSPYAIKDYYDIDPDLAHYIDQRMDEFEALIERTHKAGLKAIIDFVPNHVARQYHSNAKPDGVEDLGEYDDTSKAFDPNNNFYYIPDEAFRAPEGYHPLGEAAAGDYHEFPAKVSGNNVLRSQPDINDWFETVKLNYGVDIEKGQTHFSPIPNTWYKMKDILLFWSSKGIDGFRCDMAGMVPVEFWNWVIPQVKEEFPEMIFIAEIYEQDRYRDFIHEAKFDFLYDKVGLYDALRNVITGQQGVEQVKKVIEDINDIDDRLLRFLENHDEQRIASHHFAGDPFKALPAMVVTATAGKGPVMIYFGQEIGEPAEGPSGFSGDDGRTTIFDYWHIPEYQKWVNEGAFDGARLSEEQIALRQFYKDLLNICKKSKAISQGAFFDLDKDNMLANDNIFSYLRYSGEDRLLIICNFAETKPKISLELPIESFHKMNLDPEGKFIYEDILGSGKKITTKGRQFSFTPSPSGTFIFSIKEVD